MKCVVLAGGIGERLWPLSRINCPKQFVEIENNHSIFQDTIARNIPYCDEFIIVTNVSYKHIVENQLKPFQGLNYRCIYEKEGKNTTAAILLACLSIEETEYVFVTNTNLIVSSEQYKDIVLKAKKNAKEGFISIFVDKQKQTDKRYGYVIEKQNDNVIKYVEKPESTCSGEVYKNLGLLVFQNGVLLNELSKKYTHEAKNTFINRTILNGDTYYDSVNIPSIPIEKSLLEKSRNIKAIEIEFKYEDIRNIEDIKNYSNKGTIINTNSKVINSEENKAVVVDNIDNLVIVNTDDALYIGEKGNYNKEILKNQKLKSYTENSNKCYRHWGYYEDIINDKRYRLRKVAINSRENYI